MAGNGIVVRSYRAGDEQELAPLYNDSFAGFAGPFRLTPESWLAQWQADWRSPGLASDPECVRVAERDGRLAGYAVADHTDAKHSVLHELCVAAGDGAGAVARALLEDAEAIARRRGKLAMASLLPHEDALAAETERALGYEFDRGRATFMTLITDLARFLEGLTPELERRLAASEFAGWQGDVALKTESMEAWLRLRAGSVKVIRAAGPPGAKTAAGDLRAGLRTVVGHALTLVAVEIAPERLPLLLLGRSSVGEAYLWDELTVIARDRPQALRLLHVLFPPLPMALPRQQWW